jgi:hypothetical protein
MTSLRRRHCWSIWPAFEPSSDVLDAGSDPMVGLAAPGESA